MAQKLIELPLPAALEGVPWDIFADPNRKRIMSQPTQIPDSPYETFLKKHVGRNGELGQRITKKANATFFAKQGCNTIRAFNDPRSICGLYLESPLGDVTFTPITPDALDKIFDEIDPIFVHADGVARHLNVYMWLTQDRTACFVVHAVGMNQLNLTVYYSWNGQSTQDLIAKVNVRMEEHKYIAPPNKPKIWIVSQSSNGFNASLMEFNRQYVDIYPEERQALKEVLAETSSGAIILHGEPGSGKSSLIGLLTTDTDKPFYYLPAHLGASLDAPHFIDFLISKKEAIFVLEDAEVMLRKRDAASNSALSGILNLTDGLLGSALNQKYLLTFNAPIGDIDPAILRSGRLKYIKEFTKFNPERAGELAQKLNKVLPSKESYSLTEIFNGASVAKEKEVRRVGF